MGCSREPPAGMAFGCETAATKNRKAASAAYKAAPLQSAGLWIAFRRFSSVPFEFRSFVVVRIERGGQRELQGCSREPPAGMAFGCETAATKNRKATSAAYKAAPLQSDGFFYPKGNSSNLASKRSRSSFLAWSAVPASLPIATQSRTNPSRSSKSINSVSIRPSGVQL
jgi:hypothetical protein